MTDPNNPCIMVCVTDQLECKRLIAMGSRIAADHRMPLQILSVQPAQTQSENLAALCALYEEAKAFHAEMTVYYTDDTELTAAGHILKCNTARLVVGFPGENSTGFISAIHMIIPEIPIDMVDARNIVYHIPAGIRTKISAKSC